MQPYCDDRRRQLIPAWQHWDGREQQGADWWGAVGGGGRRGFGAGGKPERRQLFVIDRSAIAGGRSGHGSRCPTPVWASGCARLPLP